MSPHANPASSPAAQQEKNPSSSSPPAMAPTGAVYVDAITGRHVSTDPQSLLKQRQLTFSKDFGWRYDVWIDDPMKYALAGANSRFSLPAIGQRVCGLLVDGATSTAQAFQQGIRHFQPSNTPSNSVPGSST